MVGSLANAEIDFVAEKSGQTLYIQVAYLLADESTVNREFGNLMKIPDNYPKYVVSLDPISKPRDFNGIKHTPLRLFLLYDSL